jgi:hypothetical protein
MNAADILGDEIRKKFYWVWDDKEAVTYAPMLFPFVEPSKEVRDAAKALECKLSKNSQMDIQKSLFDNVYYLLRQDGRREGREYPEIKSNEAGSILPLAAGVSDALTKRAATVYHECESCNLNSLCKGAFGVITEYVASAFKELNFKAPSSKG